MDSYPIIVELLESAIRENSEGQRREDLLNAKEEYFRMTGKVNEDDDDYDGRMNAFNHWYLLQREQVEGKPPIVGYCEKSGVEQGLIDSFMNVNHSLFEYKGTNFKKLHVLKDILHNEKVVLSRDFSMPSVLEDDLFIGRVLNYEERKYLLDGICLVPRDIRSILIKESKKVRKLKDAKRDFEFLMQLESLKTKWLRYGHIDAKKIFQFRL